MSTQNNVKTVADIYEAFGKGNVIFILENIHPEVVWHSLGKDGVPYAGEFNHSNVIKFFERLAENYDVQEFVPAKIFEAEGTVYAFGNFSGKARKSGKSFSSPWAMEWGFKDGKVVNFQNYFDTLNVYTSLN